VAFTAASEANPKSDDTFYWLGLSQIKLKKNSEASRYFQRALELNSKSANANLALGTVLYAEGKLDEAEHQFKQAYKIAGKQVPIVHLHLAQLYDKTKRYKEEANELELYLKEQAGDPNAERIKKAIENLRNKN
jgi:Flp pilus assembly protein TadD